MVHFLEKKGEHISRYKLVDTHELPVYQLVFFD